MSNPDTAALYRRLERRETHSPRSLLAIILAVLVILLALYAATEIVLNMLGQRALLTTPSQLASAVSAADTYPTALVLTAGGIAVLVGVVLIIIAVSGGRRARHVLVDDRAVVVVDNEVIASALARFAAQAARVDPDNTTVTVTRRSAMIDVIPASGQPVEDSAVLAAVTYRLAGISLAPTLTPRVRVARNGKVGA